MTNDKSSRQLAVLLLCPLLLNVGSAQEYWTPKYANAEACTADEINKAGCSRTESCKVTTDLPIRSAQCLQQISDDVVAVDCLSQRRYANGKKGERGAFCRYLWDGPITELKVTKLVEFIDSSPRRENPLAGIGFYVNSEGGDVLAALQLGRTLRERNATVYPKYCASACVLLVAAGTTRMIFQAEPNRSDIFIHRPYSLDTSLSSSPEAKNQYDQLNAVIAAYLRDMNVSTALLDKMNLVPPHQVRRLSYAELEKFGLTKKDPVYEQLLNAHAAQRRNMPMTEYLRRKGLEEKCDNDHPDDWRSNEKCYREAWDLPERSNESEFSRKSAELLDRMEAELDRREAEEDR